MNEKAWREKIEDLENQLGDYGEIEKDLDVLREKARLRKTQRSIKRMVKLSLKKLKQKRLKCQRGKNR